MSDYFEEFYLPDADTIQQMQADDYMAEQAVAEHDSHENQKFTVLCDCCDRQDHGLRKELEGRGWLLLWREVFCWEHRF